jgi:hypothetical protein
VVFQGVVGVLFWINTHYGNMTIYVGDCVMVGTVWPNAADAWNNVYQMIDGEPNIGNATPQEVTPVPGINCNFEVMCPTVSSSPAATATPWGTTTPGCAPDLFTGVLQHQNTGPAHFCGVLVKNAYFIDTASDDSGGGIAISTSTSWVLFEGLQFTRCNSTAFGGGAYIVSPNATIIDACFDTCNANAGCAMFERALDLISYTWVATQWVQNERCTVWNCGRGATGNREAMILFESGLELQGCWLRGTNVSTSGGARVYRAAFGSWTWSDTATGRKFLYIVEDCCFQTINGESIVGLRSNVGLTRVNRTMMHLAAIADALGKEGCRA